MSRLGEAVAAATRIETPPNWHFRGIEVSVSYGSNDQDGSTHACAYWWAKSSRGRWTQRRSVGAIVKGIDREAALKALTMKLSDPEVDLPWRRRLPGRSR